MSKVQTGLQGASRGTNQTKDKAGRVRPSQLAASFTKYSPDFSSQRSVDLYQNCIASTQFLVVSSSEQTLVTWGLLNILMMRQKERLTCPHCGAYLTLALPPGGKGKRTFQCFDCDGPDPLKSDEVIGWLKGELAPKDGPRS